MLDFRLLLASSLCVVGAAACDEGGTTDIVLGGNGVPDGVYDNRVAIPEPMAGMVDLVSPEIIIEPGTEKMVCFHMDWDGDAAGIRGMDVSQGRYGHHYVVVNTTDPQPDGTVTDCTDRSEMDKYSAFVVPQTLPEGFAVEMPANKHIVMQSHYVNAGVEPILIRDVARLEVVPPEEVETWVSTVVTVDTGLEVPAGETYTASFDCVMDEDVELMFVAGHMHEWGTRFDFEVGPSVDELDLLYTVQDWVPEFRDSPPVEMMMDDPTPLPAGTVMRTTCNWDNTDGDHAVQFPEEMCVAFGYIAGTKTHYDCRK